MSKYTEIEKRKIVPIAAMISAGKSKLLNIIFNIDFLECKAGIGTKFVNILRYNPDIKQPRFLHLKVEKNKNKKEYSFYIDPNYEIKEGKQAIIDENKNINNILAASPQIKYEDIFYMTEVNEVEFIKDKEYLKTHDLCDIPGLSEYETTNRIKKEKEEKKVNKESEISEKEMKEKFEKEMRRGMEQFGIIYKPKKPINIKNFKEKDNEKKEKIKNENKNKENDNKNEDDIYYKTNIENETSYLTEIYKILRNYIDGIIIVLAQDNYYFEENFEIITKLYKVINRDITNSLIILNKMDLSSNPDEDIEKCKGIFMKKFPNCKTFNLNLNTFIALSAFQLQNELLMNKSYIHLIKYHFYIYMSNIKIKNITIDKSFIDHLRYIIKYEESDKKKIKGRIK